MGCSPKNPLSKAKIVKTLNKQTLSRVRKRRAESQWQVDTCKTISTCPKLIEWRNNAKLHKVFRNSTKWLKAINIVPQAVQSHHLVWMFPKFRLPSNLHLAFQEQSLNTGIRNRYTRKLPLTVSYTLTTYSLSNVRNETTTTAMQNKSWRKYKHFSKANSVPKSKSTNLRDWWNL